MRVVWQTGVLPKDELSASPFIMLLMDSVVKGETNFICLNIFGVLN